MLVALPTIEFGPALTQSKSAMSQSFMLLKLGKRLPQNNRAKHWFGVTKQPSVLTLKHLTDIKGPQN